jgi:hypothetical protein
MILILYY